MAKSQLNFSLTKRTDNLGGESQPRKGFFGDNVNKYKTSLNLASDSIETGIVQTSSFDLLNLKTIFGVSALIRKESTTFEAKSLIKWVIPHFNSVAAYFGLKQSLDGTTFLLGFKIGGIKILFPILILNKIVGKNSPDSKESQHEPVLEVLASFFMSSCILGYINLKKQKNKLKEWRASKQTLAILERFDHTTNTLRPRAKALQKAMKAEKGFVILRAYYGLRSHIKTYLNLEPDALKNYWNEDGHRRDENFGELFVCNVTIATRFKLDATYGGLKIGTDSSK